MVGDHYIGLVGTTFRRGGAEQLHFFGLSRLCARQHAASEEPEKALATALGVAECVYLATCNRVEVLFAARRELDIRTVRRRLFEFFAGGDGQLSAQQKHLRARGLHAYFDDGAIERLFVIAAALDSMVPGEAQVLGQLKQAAARAMALGLVGTHLKPLLDAAFHTAKAVREQGALGHGRVSMVSLAESLVEQALKNAPESKPSLAIVGVGEMSQICARHFGARDDVAVLIVNRGIDAARALALHCGAQAISLEGFLTAPPAVQVVVSATASPHPLFGPAFFAALAPRREQAPLMVDLAVPPDIDLAAARAAGAEVFDIDRLARLSETHRRQRQAGIGQARQLVDAAVETYEARLRDRAVSDTIRSFRRKQAAVLADKLASLPRAGGPSVYQRWAQQLSAALTHGPTQGLKTLAQLQGVEAIEAFARGAGLEDQDS